MPSPIGSPVITHATLLPNNLEHRADQGSNTQSSYSEMLQTLARCSDALARSCEDIGFSERQLKACKYRLEAVRIADRYSTSNKSDEDRLRHADLVILEKELSVLEVRIPTLQELRSKAEQDLSAISEKVAKYAKNHPEETAAAASNPLSSGVFYRVM